MARHFNGTVNEYIESQPNTFPLDNYPFTFSIWAKPKVVAVGTHYTGLGIANSSIGNNWHNVAIFDKKWYITWTNTGRATGTTVVEPDKWYHIVGVFRSSTDRELYINGISEAISSGTSIFTSFNRISVGRNSDSSPGQYFNGSLSQSVIWNASLTAQEIKLLSLGIDPQRIRKNNIVHYWEMIPKHRLELDASRNNNHGKLFGTLKPALNPPQIKPEIKRTIKKPFLTLLESIVAQAIYPIKRLLQRPSFAKQFDSADYVHFGNISAHQSFSEITVFTIIYNDNLTSDHNYFSNESSTDIPILLFMDAVVGASVDRYRFFVQFTDGTSDDLISDANIAKSGKWQILIARWKKNVTGSGMSLWIKDIDDSAITKYGITSTNKTPKDSGFAIRIGETAAATNRAHNGRVVKTASWSRSISDAEAEILLKTLDPNSINPKNLQINANLNEDNPIKDLSGNNNYGRVIGTKPALGSPLLKRKVIKNKFYSFGTAAGVSTLVKFVDEIQELQETISRKLTMSKFTDELQELQETISKRLTMSKFTDEIHELHDFFARRSSTSKNTDELQEIHETANKVSVISKFVNEIQEIYETLSTKFTLVKFVNEIQEIRETISKRMSSFRGIDELQELRENNSKKGVMSKFVNEIQELRENISRHSILRKFVDEIHNLVETVVKKLTMVSSVTNNKQVDAIFHSTQIDSLVLNTSVDGIYNE